MKSQVLRKHLLLQLEPLSNQINYPRKENKKPEKWWLVKQFNILTQTDTILYLDQEPEVFLLISSKKFISTSILFLLLSKRESNSVVISLLKSHNLTKQDNSSLTWQNSSNLLSKSAKWRFCQPRSKKKKPEGSKKERDSSLKILLIKSNSEEILNKLNWIEQPLEKMEN